MRACCCSVSHADAISSITTIQRGRDVMCLSTFKNYGDTVSVLEQVLGECGWCVRVNECVCGSGDSDGGRTHARMHICTYARTQTYTSPPPLTITLTQYLIEH